MNHLDKINYFILHSSDEFRERLKHFAEFCLSDIDSDKPDQIKKTKDFFCEEVDFFVFPLMRQILWLCLEAKCIENNLYIEDMLTEVSINSDRYATAFLLTALEDDKKSPKETK